MKIYQWSLGASLALLLVACGGGSGDVANQAPISNPGAPQANVAAASVVLLDGSASFDSEGAPLTYQWSLKEKPANSKAVLDSATAARPSFTADKVGTYSATLVVSDGQLSSQPATVTIAVKQSEAGNVATLKQIFANNDAKKFDDNLALFSPNFVGYGSSFPDNGVVRGNQAMINYFRGTEGDAFPGGAHVIHHLVTDGDYLSVDFSYTAPFSGVLNIYQYPVVPTGQPITFHYNMLLRFVDGVVTEGYWFGEDSFRLLLEMGIIKSVTF